MANDEKIVPVTEDEADDIRVTLDLDDGTVECKILTILELNETNYIALLPLDENGNDNADGDVYLYRYFEDEKGLPSIEPIIDDEEYEAISDRFDEWLDEILYNDMD
ncbi:MAG: DUF1292 domain-containing protein [Agathobacter sp.]|nr:DUF1292 domain-containing protein [Agathobacter sp.]